MNDSLQVTTSGDREIVMTRTFNAPRHLVFRAYTEPDLVKRWLTGPEGWSMKECEIDLREGGAYRYVWNHLDGREMGMGGEYREIESPQRLVNTEKFDEAWYPGECLIRTAFDEQSGSTTLTATLQYESKEARDAVVNSGMESGVRPSYDKLEALLQTMKAEPAAV